MIHFTIKKLLTNSGLIAFIQFFNILISFLLIPLFIKFFDESEYGIWLTVFSTLTWINVFDLGIGNGLRNKLSECFVRNDLKQIKLYIGSSIAFFSFFLIIFYCLFLISSYLFDFRTFFNTTNYTEDYFFNVLQIILISILLDILFKILDSVSYAIHKSFIPQLRVLVKNLLILCSLYLMLFFKIDENKLLNLSYIYLFVGVFVNVIFLLIIFWNKRDIIPSSKQISFSDFRPLADLGLKFFVIQFGALIIFSTDNFIIINYLGPQQVIQYNIISKIYLVLIIGQSFLMIPLWSAYTSKYAVKDFNWIKKTLSKSIYFSLLLSSSGVVIFFAGKFILNFWLNDDSYFDKILFLSFSIYTFFRLWSSNFSTLYNGIGRLKLQMVCVVLGAIINIPLSIFFIKNLELGSSGVILASTISLLFFSISAPIKLKSYLS
jgi:O-antigen/teichoic acid export membrane protein